MGSASKGGGRRTTREPPSTHALMLRQRVHDALALGFRIDEKGKTWHCTDAEIQFHVLRAMNAFTDCVSSSLQSHPLMKESFSEMLLALEGILQSENGRILNQAAKVTLNLIGALNSTIYQYHIMGIVYCLLFLLSSCEVSTGISCAVALNYILKNVRLMRCECHGEIWSTIIKTNAVSSLVHRLKEFSYGVQTLEYFNAMGTLLKLILWKWPSSRYPVWRNTKFVVNLVDSSVHIDSSGVICILQIFSSLALCGDVLVTLLDNREVLSMIVRCVGSEQPSNVRIEALILFQLLTRSLKGCSMFISADCASIVESVVNAMSEWRSSLSGKNCVQHLLVMEACRAASITQWPGHHHAHFWKLGIDKVLCDILLDKGTCSEIALSTNKLNNKYVKAYAWDVLGWLCVHCDQKSLTTDKERLCYIRSIISCACCVVRDWVFFRSLSRCTSETESICRAFLMMVFSPCDYISVQAKHLLSEIDWYDKYGGLNDLLLSLDMDVAGGGIVSDGVHFMINLLIFTCCSSLPCFWEKDVSRSGIQILSGIIVRCVNGEINMSRSLATSHFCKGSTGELCCSSDMEDWVGEDVILFHSLQALSQLLENSDFVCKHQKNILEEIFPVLSSSNSEVILIHGLLNVLSGRFSSGPKWFAAHNLKFFGFFGFPSKFRKRMANALHDNELADLQFVLSDKRTLKAHSAVLMAKCPCLLPPRESGLGDSGIDCGQENHGGPFQDVKMSSYVDSFVLEKLLEYIYDGFVQVDANLLKNLKVLVKRCNVEPLSSILHRRSPEWGFPVPNCGFTQILFPVESTKSMFSDIILEAKASEGAWECNVCQLFAPHIHAHKIILWAACDYLKALFQSGMQDSCSEIIKVPISWTALVKLAAWFYGGKLPRIAPGCMWKDMDPAGQLVELQAYVELSSLAEFWLLEEVEEESFNVIAECLKSQPGGAPLSLGLIRAALELGRWRIVELAVGSIAPLYPKLRDAGDLEGVEEAAVDMLRSRYACYAQEDAILSPRRTQFATRAFR